MHNIAPVLLRRTVRIALVGAGGSGSLMSTLLARMHLALVELGHPGGFQVEIFDHDTVSEANIGRQLFYETDLGRNKAEVLTHRLNLSYGLNWQAYSEKFEATRELTSDIVVGCVDTAEARAAIGKTCRHQKPYYWMDLGNRASEGQCILGQPRRLEKDWYMRLPTVLDLFPVLLTDGVIDEDDVPSCSLAEALEKQDLFVNQILVGQAANLLWRLFRYGQIAFSAVFVNLISGQVTSMAVDRDQWRRFGFKGARKPPVRNTKTQ